MSSHTPAPNKMRPFTSRERPIKNQIEIESLPVLPSPSPENDLKNHKDYRHNHRPENRPAVNGDMFFLGYLGGAIDQSSQFLQRLWRRQQADRYGHQYAHAPGPKRAVHVCRYVGCMSIKRNVPLFRW